MERTGRATEPAPAGRTAARWAVLCALLLGLFLMHGSPASAAGCHRMAPEPSAGAAGLRHDLDGHAERSVTGPVPHGSSAAACVSTQARDPLPLTAPGAAVPWTHPRPPSARPVAAGDAGGGRAPPGGGRELLLRVCVARR
ncbi:hypothetical protein [Streptomyces sp. TLI_171]|uniref:hypothetical protein n=1 Tax=Streptomyces sp. TLI_171 TaxID=1938859 RepID=UPI00117BE943|nr:hypothetical protein [Streptomyces sp. TLI_171]